MNVDNMSKWQCKQCGTACILLLSADYDAEVDRPVCCVYNGLRQDENVVTRHTIRPKWKLMVDDKNEADK